MKHQTWVVLLLASAWLLWVKDEHFSNPNPETGQWDRHTVDWALIGAFLTEERCQDSLKDEMGDAVIHRNIPSDADMLHKTEGDAISFLFFPKNARPSDTILRSQILRYYCLPERIDPRVPK